MVGRDEIKTESVVGRFAPSPTGPLHRGSLLAAVGSFLQARSQSGRWLLRIEDLDPPREQPGSAQLIIDTLRAFALDWDGEVVWQSSRHAVYAQALEQLLAANQAFACACSRRDLQGSGVHHEPCVRSLTPGTKHAVRMRAGDAHIAVDDRIQGRFEQDLQREVGDVVLRRRDGLYAYQLAVVVDDAAQGITDVVRGADLLDSTPRQIALQQLLALPTPRYAHLPVLVDASGQKLSKSRFSPALRPDQACTELHRVLRLLGQPEVEGQTPSALLAAAVAAFDPDSIPRVLQIAE